VSAATPIADETSPPAAEHGHALLYLSLLTLAGAISEVASGQAQPTWLAAATIVAFVVCVVLAIETGHQWRGGPSSRISQRGRRLHYAAVAALVPIAVLATLAFGATWLVLFAFVSITATLTVPLAWAPRTIVAVAATIVVVELAQGPSIATATTGAAWALAAGMMGYIALLLKRRSLLIRELREAQSENARLAASDAVTEERLRIARDLHDLLGHSLSVIALKAELARRLLEPGDSAQARREVADVEQIARRALGEVREVVSGYRTRSLAAELDWARASLAAAGCEVEIAICEAPLPSDVDDLFAWVVREAATNIVRHSAASHAGIHLAAGDGRARLEVRDDGAHAAAPAGRGSGLLGLQERVDAAGGEFVAGPSEGGGFTVTAVLPLGAPAVNGSQGSSASSADAAVIA